MLFTFLIAVASLIIFISQLQTALESTNNENMRLLDGMHEGVLIISKSFQRVMFCNKPAEKLLTDFVMGSQEPYVSPQQDESDTTTY